MHVRICIRWPLWTSLVLDDDEQQHGESATKNYTSLTDRNRIEAPGHG
jgi:hypothetical protein